MRRSWRRGRMKERQLEAHWTWLLSFVSVTFRDGWMGWMLPRLRILKPISLVTLRRVSTSLKSFLEINTQVPRIYRMGVRWPPEKEVSLLFKTSSRSGSNRSMLIWSQTRRIVESIHRVLGRWDGRILGLTSIETRARGERRRSQLMVAPTCLQQENTRNYSLAPRTTESTKWIGSLRVGPTRWGLCRNNKDRTWLSHISSRSPIFLRNIYFTFLYISAIRLDCPAKISSWNLVNTQWASKASPLSSVCSRFFSLSIEIRFERLDLNLTGVESPDGEPRDGSDLSIMLEIEFWTGEWCFLFCLGWLNRWEVSS